MRARFTPSGFAARAALAMVAAAVAVVGLPRPAHAQSPCPNNATVCVGPDGRVIIAPPSVRVDPNLDARVRAEAEARARADYEARMRAQQQAALDLEISRVLTWKAYLGWQARVRAEVEASASARLGLEAVANASLLADRYAGAALPRLGPEPDRHVRFPHLETSLLAFCGAVFSGPHLPAYAGFCVPVRIRLTESLSVLSDVSFVFERYRDATFHSLGLHPAFAWSFAHGRGSLAGSDAFARIGVDGQLPVSGGSASPDAYTGAHVGLGVHAQLGSTFGMGAELRGLVRGGTSDADEGASTVRLGAEIRLHAVTIAW